MPDPDLIENSDKPIVPEVAAKVENDKNSCEVIQTLRKKDRSKRKKLKAKELPKIKIQEKIDTNVDNSQVSPSTNNLDHTTEEIINMVEIKPESLKNSDSEKSKSENIESSFMKHRHTRSNAVESTVNDDIKDKENKVRKHRRKTKETSNLQKVLSKHKSVENHKSDKHRKRTNSYDIRKAPELNEQVEIKSSSTDLPTNNSNNNNDNANNNNINQHLKPEIRNQRVAIKIKLCCTCGTRHIQDHCPLQSPHYPVS